MRKKDIKKIFLAGIIQGSNKGRVLHRQDYRKKTKSILNKYLPQAKIIDPVEKHPESVYYDSEKAKKVFYQSVTACLDCDLIIAYVPEASMGTAIEMWESIKNKIPVWTISPLKENWAIRILSTKNFLSFEDLETYLKESMKE